MATKINTVLLVLILSFQVLTAWRAETGRTQYAAQIYRDDSSSYGPGHLWAELPDAYLATRNFAWSLYREAKLRELRKKYPSDFPLTGEDYLELMAKRTNMAILEQRFEDPKVEEKLAASRQEYDNAVKMLDQEIAEKSK